MADQLDLIKTLYAGLGNNPRNKETGDALKAYLGAAPIIGMPISAYDVGSGLYSGDYKKAGFGLLGLVGNAAIAKSAMNTLGDVAEGVAPWNITQEYVPGAGGHLSGLTKQSDQAKQAYSEKLASALSNLQGQVDKFWGHGYWLGDSNPTQGLSVVAPENVVKAQMAGLGRSTSQAAEAANKKIPFGGLLGHPQNAVEINLGRPANPQEIGAIANSLPDGVVFATAKNGARVFNAYASDKQAIDSGINAAKLVNGKPNVFSGKTIYFEQPEYQKMGLLNPEIANQIQQELAPISASTDAQIANQIGLDQSLNEVIRKFRPW